MKDFLKRNKKNIFNAAFLILIFAFTLYYVFNGTDGNLTDMWEKMQMTDKRWLMLAVVFIVLFIFDIVPLVWILLLILLFCSRLDCTINKSKSITFYINQLALTYLPYNVL